MQGQKLHDFSIMKSTPFKKMLNEINADFLPQFQRFIQWLMPHRVLDVTRAQGRQLLQFRLVILRQPWRLLLELHVHQ